MTIFPLSAFLLFSMAQAYSNTDDEDMIEGSGEGSGLEYVDIDTYDDISGTFSTKKDDIEGVSAILGRTSKPQKCC